MKLSFGGNQPQACIQRIGTSSRPGLGKKRAGENFTLLVIVESHQPFLPDLPNDSPFHASYLKIDYLAVDYGKKSLVFGACSAISSR